MPIAIGKNGTTRGKNPPNLWFQWGRDACRRTPGSKNWILNRPGRTRTCDPLLRSNARVLSLRDPEYYPLPRKRWSSLDYSQNREFQVAQCHDEKRVDACGHER